MAQTDAAHIQFLASLSHEIRTPLTVILGFAEILHDADLTDVERSNAVAAIRRNTDVLLRVLDDLLDPRGSRAESARTAWSAIAPESFVREVCAALRPRAQTKSLTLACEFARDLPREILSDPTRLRQILYNVVDNAITHTQAGSIRVCVAQGAEVPPSCGGVRGPWLRIEVRDTGSGMSPEQARRVFDPYRPPARATSRNEGRRGLGLAFCRQLAGLLGGTIDVASTPGQGSTFRIWIVARTPASEVIVATVRTRRRQAETDHATNSAAPALRANRATTNETHLPPGCRILLAEDCPDNQRLISHWLRRAGAEVTVVPNGKLALAAALVAREGGRPFELVLLDMQMPITDGYDAARALRQRGYTGPIVALTACAGPADRQTCLDAGCDDYVRKPVDHGEFLAVVRRSVEQTAAPAAPVPPPLPPGAAPQHASHLVRADETPERAELTTLVQTFVNDLPRSVDELHARLEGAGLDGLLALTRQLSGTCAGLGMVQVLQEWLRLDPSGSEETQARFEELRQHMQALAELCMQSTRGSAQ